MSKEYETIKVALGDPNEYGHYTVWDFFSHYVISPEDDPNCKPPNTLDIFSIPNSNAFVDMDGDCLPDLFLTR